MGWKAPQARVVTARWLAALSIALPAIGVLQAVSSGIASQGISPGLFRKFKGLQGIVEDSPEGGRGGFAGLAGGPGLVDQGARQFQARQQKAEPEPGVHAAGRLGTA